MCLYTGMYTFLLYPGNRTTGMLGQSWCTFFFISTLHEKHDGKNKKCPSLSESLLSTHSACYWTTITNNNGNLLAPSSSSRPKFNRTSASRALELLTKKGTESQRSWEHTCTFTTLFAAVHKTLHLKGASECCEKNNRKCTANYKHCT